ncbi:hypothetical protein DBR17_08860 [Sphingomonas sp. HMWF008]|nr:hypothetical protein DBR17_08860 [Sphingomonas sp. HMWF008]
MAVSKARSPSYPAIGLKEAIEKADAVYRNDYQNQVPRAVAAKHMGYASLNGKSLGVLSALLKFGLLEGRGDNTRVSDLALRIIAHSPGEPERADAIREASTRPELFTELDKRYPDGKGSDAAIRSYLLTQKFIPQAAESALRSYRETKTLVETECAAYDSAQPDAPDDMQTTLDPSPLTSSPHPASPTTPVGEGFRRAIFDLSEGEVVITFPEEMSPESVGDLHDYLATFMKKARREAGVPEPTNGKG